jgi:hypothetical protein
LKIFSFYDLKKKKKKRKKTKLDRNTKEYNSKSKILLGRPKETKPEELEVEDSSTADGET